MPKYRFHVVGINHHDYKDRLEELYAKAVGNSMSMHIEAENEFERNAVRVYLIDEFVGYVMTGPEREQAAKMVLADRLSVIGKITAIDRENRMLTLEVDTEKVFERKGREVGKTFRKWRYNGSLLRQTDQEVSLKAMMDNLQMCIEQQQQWNYEMNRYLQYIGNNLWRDAGAESMIQLDEIVSLLTANSDNCSGYDEAARKLLYYMTEVNSPESRQKQAAYLTEISQSDDIKHLIRELGDEAKSTADRIPLQLRRLYDRNPLEYIGRLRYLRCPYRQVRQLQTLMAMRIALKRNPSTPRHTKTNVNEVLTGGEQRLNELAEVIGIYYQDSTKNLALIYCVVRDRGFLVDSRNYLKFVAMLVSQNILPPMDEKKTRCIANGVSQYMRDRNDHHKLRTGLRGRFTDWDEGKDKELCQKISQHFS